MVAQLFQLQIYSKDQIIFQTEIRRFSPIASSRSRSWMTFTFVIYRTKSRPIWRRICARKIRSKSTLVR